MFFELKRYTSSYNTVLFSINKARMNLENKHPRTYHTLLLFIWCKKIILCLLQNITVFKVKMKCRIKQVIYFMINRRMF